MSTEQISPINCTSLDDTLKLAEQIGHKLHGGEVIELRSDVGGGKTTFVKGLVRGMGSKDTVHSPSFTISNVYRSKTLTMYHFDFYRLTEPGIMRVEIEEVLANKQAVVVIEWADIIQDVLPADRLTVTIKSTGETERIFMLASEDHYTHLLPINT